MKGYRHMKKYGAVIGIWLILLLFGGCSLQSTKKTEADTKNLPVLVIGSDNYEPYNYLDEDGNQAGIDVELAIEACRRMGYAPEFKQIPWDQKNSYLNRKEVDCLWGSFTMTGREDLYTWAGPYLYSRQVVAVQRDGTIQSLADLKGKRVAVQATTKPEDVLLKMEDPRIPNVKEVYSLSTMEELYASLRKGYVDAIAGHESALRTFVESDPDSYRLLEESLYVSELGVAFRKGDHEDLAKQLTQTFEEMKADSFIRKVVQTYGLDAERALGEQDEK